MLYPSLSSALICSCSKASISLVNSIRICVRLPAWNSSSTVPSGCSPSSPESTSDFFPAIGIGVLRRPWNNRDSTIKTKRKIASLHEGSSQLISSPSSLASSRFAQLCKVMSASSNRATMPCTPDVAVLAVSSTIMPPSSSSSSSSSSLSSGSS